MGRVNLLPNFRWFCHERAEESDFFKKRSLSSSPSYGGFADLRLADWHLRNLQIAIFRLQKKTLRLAICELAHLRYLRICDSWMSPRICDSRTGASKKFADLRFADQKSRFVCPPLIAGCENLIVGFWLVGKRTILFSIWIVRQFKVSFLILGKNIIHMLHNSVLFSVMIHKWLKF